MRRLRDAVGFRPASRLLITALLLISIASACGGGGGEDVRTSSAPPSTTPYVPAIIEPPAAAPPTVTVQQVVDVRTVRLSDGEEVRINGLAAPDGCWADASTTFARTMLLEKPVDSTPGADHVVSLRLADGTDYALLAVGLGMVRSEAADDRAMKEAEEAASAKRLGRWGPPCATPPGPATPAAAPTTAPAAPKPVTGCSVEYRVTNTWPGGFRTDVTIRNTGTTDITGWTLQWKFTDGQKVSEMWNATQKQSGQDVSATAMPYNQSIRQGESQLTGFTGTSGATNTTPRAFTLNGHACTLA
jgi:endonuclease YncB( thermonuclease family)